jgi:AAA+ superfamily predicted ATPase
MTKRTPVLGAPPSLREILCGATPLGGSAHRDIQACLDHTWPNLRIGDRKSLWEDLGGSWTMVELLEGLRVAATQAVERRTDARNDSAVFQEQLSHSWRELGRLLDGRPASDIELDSLYGIPNPIKDLHDRETALLTMLGEPTAVKALPEVVWRHARNARADAGMAELYATALGSGLEDRSHGPSKLSGTQLVDILGQWRETGMASIAEAARLARVPIRDAVAEAIAERRAPDDTHAADEDEDDAVAGSPVTTAASRQLIRTLDAVPGLRQAMAERGVVVVVDVPDRLTLAALDGATFTAMGLQGCRRAIYHDAPKNNAEREKRPKELYSALRASGPLLCLSPDAGSCLPPVALQAAEHRLTLSPIDAGDLAVVIRSETGRSLSESERAALASLSVTAEHLAIAVRPRRTAATIIAELRRLTAPSVASGRGRDLTLDDLHGARAAVAWCRSTIRDLEGWRNGLPWSTVSNGALMFGPPGTGKTLIAQAFAVTAGIPLVTGSLPLWQSMDAAHLGTTLKAMRASFDEARSKAAGRRGCILLIDEIDAFPDRRGVRHDHADYVVEVVNALLEQLDGAVGREGVIVIGTTNDRDRVDPAIRRPGRLGKSIEIGLPDVEERVAMIRVRLGGDLPGADLLPVAYRTERHTGAMIEALVEDARRRARHADRPLVLDDLLAVAGARDEGVSADTLDRTAVHEAGHALLATLDDPAADMVVALQSGDGMGGWVSLGGAARGVWTRAQAEARIRTILAGRAAEDILLDAPSSGASLDLAQATRMVVEMTTEWGLGGRGLVAASMDPATAMATDPMLRREVQETLDRLYAETTETVRRHAGAVRRIADALVEQRRLDGAQVARLVAEPSVRRH